MTKTRTATTAVAPDRADLTTQGALLLQAYLSAIAQLGYRKTAVDTWRNDAERHNIRHQYTNGEWSLASWTDGGGVIELRYSVRATMPDVSALVSATLPPAF
jgi:hypothetical protein